MVIRSELITHEDGFVGLDVTYSSIPTEEDARAVYAALAVYEWKACGHCDSHGFWVRVVLLQYGG